MSATAETEAPRPEAEGFWETLVEFTARVPRRVLRKLDDLAAGEHRRSRPALLEWLADTHDQIMAAEAELGPREADLDQREAEVAAVERRTSAQQQELEEAILRARRRLGLSEPAWELLSECMEAGLGKGEILAIAAVCRDSGVDAAALAATLREQMGLVEYGTRLRAAVAQAEAKRDELLEEASAARLAGQQIAEGAGALQVQVARSREQLAAQAEALEHLQATLRGLGLFLDLLGGQRLDDLPTRALRITIGALLLVYCQLHPRACGPFVLPPNVQSNRFMPAPVDLRELPGLLGRPEDYAAMEQALSQRAAMAGRFQRPPAPAAPPPLAPEDGAEDAETEGAP